MPPFLRKLGSWWSWKKLRRVHLYLGCFFAPLLLFYVATGWYQTLHPNRNKAIGVAGDWISRLTSVHVDQIFPRASVQRYSPGLFRGLVVAMSIALSATILIGILLAFRSTRVKWPVWTSLALGVCVPILLLWLGQHK